MSELYNIVPWHKYPKKTMIQKTPTRKLESPWVVLVVRVTEEVGALKAKENIEHEERQEMEGNRTMKYYKNKY